MDENKNANNENLDKVTSIDSIDPAQNDVQTQTIEAEDNTLTKGETSAEAANIPAEEFAQNQYSHEYSYNAQQSGANLNEVSYYPDKNKKKSKKFLTGMVAVICVLAIGLTSVVGYSMISGKGISISVSDQNNGNGGKSSGGGSTANASNRDTKNLPTVTQLATPADALSIPEIVNKVSGSVVGISASSSSQTATGTGVIMSEDGYIITNAHVVSGASSLSVVFTDKDKTSMKAELIGIDSQTDLAVIKIDKKGLTPAEFGKSSELQVGEIAIAIGNPLGFELAGSVTSGIISALDRTLTIEDQEMNLIQTDASINNGNSGGALVNAYGQVIGITSAKVSSTYGEGLGFAIPIDNAKPIIDDLIKYGYVKGRPVLGLSGQTITELWSQYYGVPQGFIVRNVEDGSAADKAGIQVGDVVIGINDTTITSISEFNKIKAKYKAGDTITITLYRQGNKKNVKATLDEDTSTAKNNESQNTTESNQDGYSYYGNDDGYYNPFGAFGNFGSFGNDQSQGEAS